MYSYIFTFLSLLLLASASEVADYDGWLQIRLWHSISTKSHNHEFKERGNVTVSSVRSGSSIITQSSLSPVDVNDLLAIAASNKKYILKATIKTSSGSETTFLASALACNLIGSGLQDFIHVWLDSTSEPIAVNILSKGPCVQTTHDFTENKFMTQVEIKYPDGGPTPDTFTYIQKLEREKQARESGEVKDNRSFFAKYWMYIIPALVFFVLSSATNPEAGGGGNGAVQRQ